SSAGRATPELAIESAVGRFWRALQCPCPGSRVLFPNPFSAAVEWSSSELEHAESPPLVRKEDSGQDDSDRDAQPDREREAMRGKESSRQQGDAETADDVVDTRDHRRRRGDECNAAPQLQRRDWRLPGSRSLIGAEVLSRLGSQRAVKAADACDVAKVPHVLASDIDEANH